MTTSIIDFGEQLSNEVDTYFTRRWTDTHKSFIFEQLIYLGKELPKMSVSLKSRYWAELDLVFKSVSIYKSMSVSHSLHITLTSECPEGFRDELSKRIYCIKGLDR